MIINTEIINGGAVFTLCGRLDTQTVELLRNEIDRVDFKDLDSATFDLRDVEYISSAGLRAFVTVRKKFKTNEQVMLTGVNKTVMDVLKCTGTYMFFAISEFKEEQPNYIYLSYKDLLNEKVKATPDEIFLIGEEKYNWTDIEKGSQAIANDLYDLGVRKGSHVAIYGANSINWVLCFFAIQKLGAIASLVNFNLNEKEVVLLSSIGDITHICCGDAPLTKDLDAFSNKILNDKDSLITSVYDIRSSIDFRKGNVINPSYSLDAKVESDDVAVMIFTSGSTGRPKGVLLSAYNVLNASYAHMKSVRQCRDDKACLILPLFHIFGLLSGLCTGMLAGSKVVIPKDLHTKTILSAVAEHECTILHSVPTMMLALVNNREFSSEQVKSLRSTILAGASITESQIYMLKEKFPNNHFSISYGLSEMAPVTVTEYEDSVEHITKTVGKAVENIEIKIRNIQTGVDCKGYGESGEIMVRGYNLMTCYYKLDIDDQAVDDEGWLFTGDLGYIDSEGYLHIEGRLKELIIRGGENIIPNEVASAITQHGAISDAKVMGVPDDFYGEIVVAAIMLKDGCTFDEKDMRAFLKSKLAPFKIPKYFVVYDCFPTLSNGKVDAVNLKKDLCRKCNK